MSYDIEKAKLLSEAKDLVTKAVKAGLMSYPLGTKFDITGSPIALIDPDDSATSCKYTHELCLKAYQLRDLGMALEDVARQCQVPKGSAVSIIAKGHELHLQAERQAYHPSTIN